MRIDGMKRAVALFRHQQVREFNQRSKAQFVYVGPPRRSLTQYACVHVCVCARGGSGVDACMCVSFICVHEYVCM
jgi:hypothetical protein